jgi:hypothetical protein
LASSLTKKQPASFLLGLVLNFLFWQGTNELGFDLIDFSVHYHSMSKGLISFGDLLFFGGFIGITIGGTQIRLRQLI